MEEQNNTNSTEHKKRNVNSGLVSLELVARINKIDIDMRSVVREFGIESADTTPEELMRIAKSRGFKIKKSVIRGVESNGMICALFELGLEDKTEENYNKGICILDNDAPVGGDPIKYLGFDDTIFELDLNPNRSDCTNHLGFAYEVAAVMGKNVKMPDTLYEETPGDINDKLSIDVKTDNCMMYRAKVVKDVKIKESPKFIKERLEACGIRSINNVVDISNYVMLEYGQPLHFFDKDIVGDYLNVRMAKEGERMVTLDGNERELLPSDIVICNDKEVLALACVIG